MTCADSRGRTLLSPWSASGACARAVRRCWRFCRGMGGSWGGGGGIELRVLVMLMVMVMVVVLLMSSRTGQGKARCRGSRFVFGTSFSIGTGDGVCLFDPIFLLLSLVWYDLVLFLDSVWFLWVHLDGSRLYYDNDLTTRLDDAQRPRLTTFTIRHPQTTA